MIYGQILLFKVSGRCVTTLDDDAGRPGMFDQSENVFQNNWPIGNLCLQYTRYHNQHISEVGEHRACDIPVSTYTMTY